MGFIDVERDYLLLLFSICSVPVQYMSSTCSVINWTCSAVLLRFYCTEFEANTLLLYGNSEGRPCLRCLSFEI